MSTDVLHFFRALKEKQSRRQCDDCLRPYTTKPRLSGDVAWLLVDMEPLSREAPTLGQGA
jgi:hypothetical protein